MSIDFPHTWSLLKLHRRISSHYTRLSNHMILEDVGKFGYWLPAETSTVGINYNYYWQLQPWSQELEKNQSIHILPLPTPVQCWQNTFIWHKLHLTIFQHWKGEWRCRHLFSRYYSHEFIFLTFSNYNLQSMVVFPVQYREYKNSFNIVILSSTVRIKVLHTWMKVDVQPCTCTCICT